MLLRYDLRYGRTDHLGRVFLGHIRGHGSGLLLRLMLLIQVLLTHMLLLLRLGPKRARDDSGVMVNLSWMNLGLLRRHDS